MTASGDTATQVFEEERDAEISRIFVLAGPDEGVEHRFSARRITIGTSTRVDVALTDELVSGVHCELVRERGSVRMRDLGSKNGVWLAGCRVLDVWLTPRTRFQLGDTVIEVGVDQVRMPMPTWRGGDSFGPLVGASARMRTLFAQLQKLAASEVRVLVRGESGTGKELVARALHEHGVRREGPFVVVDGAALSGDLADTELFGQVKGAFTVALADGVVHELEAGLLGAVQEMVLGTDFELDALEPIGAEELADVVPPGIFRERILRGCLLMALADTEASEPEAKVLDEFAEALDVERAPLIDFHRILEGHLGTLRLDIVRRSFIGKRVGQHVREKGIRGLAEAALSFGGNEVPAVANRYRSLETYPAGTLGKGYADFMRKNEFALPGEPNGAPEPIVFHDCVHILAGYDTTPEEEVLAAAFQAGFQKYDPFFSLLFVICQFHLGIQISPIAGTEKMKMQPATMMEAFLRGTRCTVDMSDGWSQWDHFARPIEEIRKEYGIEPRP